ncbi:MAG: excinuclease ABC subunit UvrC [Ruminococcaceae bacterium]|nr:excinuclease ABC subunit UvrC [Oscillospiraceae bacterium]
MDLVQLKQKANNLPLKPGVYIMKDKGGNIIYIGKAKQLKNRVTQYFGLGNQHTQKVKKMVSFVEDFEYIICDSEFEALILENSLIKQNQPKYNILLKDDKGYFYIKITDDKWKKIVSTKQYEKDGEYIGPYNSGFVVNQTVDQVNKIFKLPNCNRSFDTKSKPCLNYHIGICFAPCTNNISIEEYNEIINSATDYIKQGEFSENTVEILKQKMENAAENLQFETAARLRDRINAISKVNEKQKVVSISYKNQDVIATATFGDKACIEVLIFRNYKLVDKRHYFFDEVNNKDEIMGEFLQQYYFENSNIPNRILIDTTNFDYLLLEEWLTKKSGHKVSIIVPKKSDGKKLLDMCISNAAQNLSEKTKRDTKEMALLNELALVLGLENPPKIIEAYDISNTAGENNVAGMIVFNNAKPYKKGYKRFKIKSFVGQDDYRSMAEVLDRRFIEYEKGEDITFSQLPDLILLDGAKGQISAVLPILQKHNINVPVFGMVKDSKHRTRAIATSGGDIDIKSTRKVFTLITNIQDEVHRFAISYQRKLQSKKLLSRELTQIEGIGEKKANLLLKHFKSMSKIKTAKYEDLVSIKGITEINAKKIATFFGNL